MIVQTRYTALSAIMCFHAKIAKSRKVIIAEIIIAGGLFFFFLKLKSTKMIIIILSHSNCHIHMICMI